MSDPKRDPRSRDDEITIKRPISPRVIDDLNKQFTEKDAGRLTKSSPTEVSEAWRDARKQGSN